MAGSASKSVGEVRGFHLTGVNAWIQRHLASVTIETGTALSAPLGRVCQRTDGWQSGRDQVSAERGSFTRKDANQEPFGQR
jgi:hypothetical protein